MVGSDETPRRPPRLQGRLTPATRPASAAGQEHPPDVATQRDHPRHRAQLRRAAWGFAVVPDECWQFGQREEQFQSAL